MICLRVPLLSLLILAAISFSSISQADELKDISQLLAQGQHAQAESAMAQVSAAKDELRVHAHLVEEDFAIDAVIDKLRDAVVDRVRGA